MLWLDKRSIRDFSIDDYTRIVQERNFSIRKVLGYSKKSCVFLTSRNTVIKILNPDLSYYYFKNFIRANELFSKCGIKTPRILSVEKSGDFYIIESQYINPQLFSERRPLIRSDEIFFSIFDKLSKVVATNFGPLITREGFLPPAFTNCNYLQYWDNQLNHYLAKITDKSFRRKVKRFYKILRAQVKKPDQFILSHSDISPKHIFIYQSQIGCIDLEESMYLDPSFMWAIWHTRTVHKRTKTSNNIFFKQFFLRNLDFDTFRFHFYRELLIQYYYQKLLDKFFKDYSRFSVVDSNLSKKLKNDI